MYKMLGTALIAAGLLAAQPAAADQAKAQAAGCMACHQVAAKLVGPSYQDVASKYKGNADAKTVLIGKVRGGGVGTSGRRTVDRVHPKQCRWRCGRVLRRAERRRQLTQAPNEIEGRAQGPPQSRIR